MSSCIFCRIVNQEIPAKIIWQSQELIVIEDIAPKAPIHWLIIPRAHHNDICAIEPESAILPSITFAVQYLRALDQRAQDFRLVVNTGAQAGQTVFHLHVHFLAGAQLPGL